MNKNLNDQEKPTIIKQGKCISCTSRDCRIGNSLIFYFSNMELLWMRIKIEMALKKSRKNRTFGMPFSRRSEGALSSRFLPCPGQLYEGYMTLFNEWAQFHRVPTQKSTTSSKGKVRGCNLTIMFQNSDS